MATLVKLLRGVEDTVTASIPLPAEPPAWLVKKAPKVVPAGAVEMAKVIPVYAPSKYTREEQEELDTLRAAVGGHERFCPHCEETKTIIPHFGISLHRNHARVQPWCVVCRATTSENYRKTGRERAAKKAKS